MQCGNQYDPLFVSEHLLCPGRLSNAEGGGNAMPGLAIEASEH